MAHDNGIITAPVSIEDVKAVLDENTNDLAALCTSKKINKWSRRKPVDSYVLFCAKESDFEAANYGLKVPVLGGTFEKCIEKIIDHDPSTLWEYLQPKGGRNSPYRLTDFEHYNHNASPPFPAPLYKTYNFNIANGEINIAFDLTVDEADFPNMKSYNVELSELKSGIENLGDYRLAIAVRNPKSPSAGTLRFESAKTLGEGGDTVKVKANNLFQGFTYDCYPLFFREKDDGTFDIVPSDGTSFQIKCYRNEAGELGGNANKKPIVISLSYVDGTPTGTVVINNYTSDAVTLSEGKIKFFKYDDITSEEIDVVYWKCQTAITIPANGQKTLTVSSTSNADGNWEFGNKPQYDLENVTYAQFQSSNLGKAVNSEIEEVW